MKQKRIAVWCAALLCLGLSVSLAACGMKQDRMAQEAPWASPLPESMPTERVPLSEEALLWFQTNYFGGEDYPNVYQMLTLSLYESPEDIHLYDTFYMGNPLDTASLQGTEELTRVQEMLPPGEGSVVKNSPQAMGELLEAATGYTLEETNQRGLELFTYVKEFDAYYHYRGDTNDRMDAEGNWMNILMYCDLKVEYGEQDAEGNVYLYYSRENHTGCTGWILRLTQQEDGNYFIVSNREVGRLWDAQDMPPKVQADVLGQAKGAYWEQAEILVTDPDFYYENEQGEQESYTYPDYVWPDEDYLDVRATELRQLLDMEIAGESFAIYGFHIQLQPYGGGVTYTQGETITSDGWADMGEQFLLYWNLEEEEAFLYGEMIAISDIAEDTDALAQWIIDNVTEMPKVSREELTSATRIYGDSEKEIVITAEDILVFYEIDSDSIVLATPLAKQEASGIGFALSMVDDAGEVLWLDLPGYVLENYLNFAWQCRELEESQLAVWFSGMVENN